MSSKPPTLQEIDINLLHPCRFQTRLFGPDDSKDPVLVGLAASIQVGIEVDALGVSEVCDSCRCTHNLCCHDENGVACHWVNDERTLCSNCQRILYNWIEYALNEKSASEAAKSTQ